VSARIDKNGVKTAKLELKHDSRRLICRRFETKRVLAEETEC
jgi:hypothetical protein